MSSSNEFTDSEKAHEACGWRKFENSDAPSDDDSDDGGIKVVARKYSNDESNQKQQDHFDTMIDKNFQGVVVVSLSEGRSASEVIKSIIDISNVNNKKRSSSIASQIPNDIYNLPLDNKYFETNVQLLDYNACFENKRKEQKSVELSSQIQFKDCYAVVIFMDCNQSINFDKLNETKINVNQVRGEPRILACDSFDHESKEYGSIVDWCVDNEFEFIPNVFKLDLDDDQEGGYQRFIDALSAYRWPHLKMKKTQEPKISSDKLLNSDIMKKIEDFDELLTKLNHYRGRPTLVTTTDQQRNDDELLEIAQKLSSILGDDYGDLLEDDETLDDNHEAQNKRPATDLPSIQ